MKEKRAVRLLVAGIGSVLIVSGCWSSSSSPSGGGSDTPGETPGVSTVQVAGYVEDPGIRGARVELWNTAGAVKICGSAADQLCRTVSEDDGYFRFNAKSDALSGLRVVSVGGSDGETGLRLGDLTLKALLDAASSRSSVAVTPVTTLVALVVEGGKSLEVAQAEVRRFLDLAEDVDLTLRPMGPGGGVILKKSMVITKILTDLVTEGKENAMERLMASLEEGRKLMENGSLVESTLEKAGLSEDRRKEALLFHEALEKGDVLNPEALVLEAKKALLTDTLMKSMERLLGTADADFEAHRDLYRENAGVLAESLLTHGGMPVQGLSVERVFRYLLAAYDLVQMELNTEGTAYEVSGRLVSGRLEPGDLKKGDIPLSQDPRIDELAKAAYLYDVAEALLPTELPGNDNAKRVAYYYNSNVSRLYMAETMLDTVLDDNVNDAIRAEIARGKAKVGLFEDAKAIIREQMYLDNHKVTAWMGIASGYIPFDMHTEATEALDQAFQMQKNLITSKGVANLAHEDTTRLQTMVTMYRNAGRSDKAEAVMDYMAKDVLPGIDNTSHYGRLLVAMRNQADAYLAYKQEDTSGQDLAMGRAMLEGLHQFASVYPENNSNGRKHYKARVYYLAETALRFAALGDRGRVEALVEEIEAIRENDGLTSYPDTNPQELNATKAETWVYVPNMVEALAEAGSEEKAWALVATIPEAQATYLGSSYAALASILARQNKPDELLELVDTRVVGVTPERLPDSTMAMRMAALTYVNNVNPKAGVILAEAGHFAAAERVGDHALRYANALYNRGATDANVAIQKVHYGYVRTARVFYLAGAGAKAVDALERAETVIFGGDLEVERGDGRGGLLKNVHGDYETEVVSFAGISTDERRLYAIYWVSRMWSEIGNPSRALKLLEKGRDHLESIAETQTKGFLAAEYNKLILSALESQAKAFAASLLDQAEAIAEAIHTDATPEAQRESALETEAAQLRGLGEKAYEAGETGRAQTLFRKALEAAKLLSSKAKQGDQMKAIALSAGSAGLLELAMETAFTIPVISDRYETLGEIAQDVVRQDDFSGVSIAWVDTDKDGKPDFFHPLATAEMIAASGLVLDEDSNGNGIPDTEDLRPLYRGL
jgi:hypothetical protein